jgi:hypothetical protein
MHVDRVYSKRLDSGVAVMCWKKCTYLLSVFLVSFLACLSASADDAIFSGPQVGEPLPAFTVRGVLGDDAGKDLDFVTQADGKPIVLVFVHGMTRPSIGLVRTLTAYTSERPTSELVTGVVWLDDDATEAENTIKRVKHALAPKAPIGISLDGQEGPGSYGLNRNVMLTILVGKEGKTTANFALVQPSLASDLPKILEEVVRVAGGQVPKLSDLPGAAQMMRAENGRGEAAGPDAKLRSLLRPVIQKTASQEDVDKAAKELEQYVANNDTARIEVGRIANRIVNAGVLGNYGTAHAQDYLKKWAQEYGKEGDQAAPTEQPDARKTQSQESSTDNDQE